MSLVVGALGSCSTSASVHLDVDHPAALVDTPLSIHVTGLSPYHDVTLRLTAADATGVTWSSRATFTADAQGEIDVARDAPRSGSYSGLAAMGLFWSMMPSHAPRGDTNFMYAATGFRARLEVLNGTHLLASRTLTRAAAVPGLVVRDERPNVVGFFGEYYAPREPNDAGTAVVVMGGSEGGLATAGLAQLLASHGYPTLALAYFGEPGLPRGISDIPLEYFSRAIEWLAQQQGVNPDRIDLLGISRGAEVALLTASYFPNKVHAVIVAAPTSVVNPPEPDPRGSAWTYSGRPVPAIGVSEFGDPTPNDSRAVIAVENIDGPLFLVCGTNDAAWPSCAYARAIEARRVAHHVENRDVVVKVPGAGHGVASLVPFISEASTSAIFGGDRLADGAGRAAAWHEVLTFLSRP